MSDNELKQPAELVKNRIQAFAFVIATAAAVVLSVFLAGLAEVGREETSAIEIDGRINANEETAVSLARLPGIGRRRAEAIIGYRRDFAMEDKEKLAFKDGNDMKKVKGIGDKTAEQIKPFLRFGE